VRYRALLFTAALSVCTFSNAAFAQGDAAKLEQATKLYEEATKLLDEKRFDEACPKLEQAVQLVPVASGAQLALGACYEGKGKLGSAYRKYEEAAALAKAANQADREQRARDALAALSPRVARLTINPSADMRAVKGFVTKLDGAEAAQTTWGAGQPIDSGDHAVHAEAPGYEPLDVKVTIQDGENRNLEVELSKQGAAPPPSPTATPTEAPGEEGGGSPVRTAGLIVGGVGIAGLIVGAVTGGMALGKKSDGDVGCSEGDPPRCPQAAVDARDDGFTFATISTIGFIAGGALVAGGVVLFVVGGEGSGGERTAFVKTEARPGGVVVSGAF
jgi:hypothetical protein